MRYQIGIDYKIIVWRRLRNQMPNIRFDSTVDIIPISDTHLYGDNARDVGILQSRFRIHGAIF